MVMVSAVLLASPSTPGLTLSNGAVWVTTQPLPACSSPDTSAPTLHFPSSTSTESVGRLGLAGTRYTIAMWLKPATGLNSAPVRWDILGPTSGFSGCYTGRCLHMYFRRDGAGLPRLLFGSYSDAVVAPERSDLEERWTHWAFTFDSSNQARSILQDGAVIASAVGTTTLTVDTALSLGLYVQGYSDRGFLGYMAKVAVWTDVLAPSVLSEVAACDWETTVVPASAPLGTPRPGACTGFESSEWAQRFNQ